MTARSMFRRLSRALRGRGKILERIVLREDGFDLFRNDRRKGGLWWRDVSKIVAFKDDLLTYDLVCLEFFLQSKGQVFEVNDDVEGFWAMVERIKEVFPHSNQTWEASVLKPAFARNVTVIYERSTNIEGG